MEKSRFRPANFSCACVIRGGCGLFLRRNTPSRQFAIIRASHTGTGGNPRGRFNPIPSATVSKNLRLLTNSPSVMLNTSPTQASAGASMASNTASATFPTYTVFSAYRPRAM